MNASSRQKSVWSILVATLMVMSAVVAVVTFAAPAAAAPAPTQNLTLSPGIAAEGTGVTSDLSVTQASTATFTAGAALYYEFSTTGTWSSSGTAWFTLPAGVATIPVGTLTPSWGGAAAGSYYFLVSASSTGATAVYASQAITVAAVTTLPTFSPSATSSAIGSTLKVTGSGYTAGDSVNVYLYDSDASGTVGWNSSTLVASTTATATGTISVSFTVPDISGPTAYLSVVDTTASTYGYNTVSTATAFYSAIAIKQSITLTPSSILAEGSFTIAGTGYTSGTAITSSSISIGSTPTITGFTTTPSTGTTVASDGTFSIGVNTAGATFSTPGYGSTTVTVSSGTAALVVATPTITVSPTSIIPGGSFTVTGSNFAPGSTIAANSVTVAAVTAKNSVATVSSTGTFTMSVATNSMSAFTTGSNTVKVTATQTGLSQAATASLDVLAGSITVSPTTMSPGGSVTITGVDFYPSATIGANSIVVGGATADNPAVTVSSTGGFTVTASTLSFTGTLTSSSTAGVTVTVALPSGVTVNSATTETGSATVDLLSPQVTILYPSGSYSLTAGETVSITVTNLFPGATIGKNLVTLDSATLLNAAQTVPSSGTLTFSVTVPATFTPGSGVYAFIVPEVAPSGLSISPSSASTYAILSTPTMNALTVYVNGTGTVPGASLTLQPVGTMVTAWLFGYPAGATVSVTMGSDTVIASATTDANGGFFGVFAIPALPGSSTGVSYTVNTASASGLVATTPATVSVIPSLTLTGTEAYFSPFCTAATGAGCYLQAGDSFTLTGTGFNAAASVTLTDTASIVVFPVSVMTDGTGSFSILATVSSTATLTTETLDTVTASTTSSGSVTAIFDELATPTLTITSATSGTSLTTAGGAPGVAGADLVSNTVTGITYSVTSPVSTGPTGLTHGSPTGTMAISATAATGVYTATIAPSDSAFPSGTATFEVSNPSSAGYLANGTGGHVIDTAAGGTFAVYALGFSAESSTTIALSATHPSTFTFTVPTHSYAKAGGAVFSVTVAAAAAQGGYLIYGTQSSSSYTTSVADSVTVVIGPVFTQPGTAASGGTFAVSGTGFAPNSVFSVYFGDGVHAGTNIGTLSSGASGSIVSTTLTAPVIDGGGYMIGVAPYTAASTIPVSAVFSSTLGALVITNNVVWSPDPSAFPGELVSFSYTLSAALSPVPIAGTTQALVLLNGADYAEVPVTYDATALTLSGSFTMFNGMPGSAYTLNLEPIYQTSGPTVSNDTQTVSWTAPSTAVPEAFTWSIPAGPGHIVSVSGYLTDTTTGAATSLTGDYTYTQPTSSLAGSVTLTVPAAAQTATNSYTATTTIELNSGTGLPTSVVGVASSSTMLTLVNGSGALLVSVRVPGTVNVSAASIAEIATQSGAYVNLTLAQLNAKVTSVEDGVAYLNTSFGQMSASLKAIGASVTSIASGVAYMNSSLGKIATSLQSLNATIRSLNQTVVELSSIVGTLSGTLSSINTTVIANSKTLVTIETSVGSLSGTITSMNSTVATIQTNVGTLLVNTSAIQGLVKTGNSQTSSVPNITTYLIIVIVLAIIAIVVGLLAVMRVNAVARRLEGRDGSGGSQEPPK